MTKLKTDGEKSKTGESGAMEVMNAIASLMQFVEKADSHITMLNTMSIDDKTKWQTIAALFERDVPKLKKEVSTSIAKTIDYMLHKTDAKE